MPFVVKRVLLFFIPTQSHLYFPLRFELMSGLESLLAPPPSPHPPLYTAAPAPHPQDRGPAFPRDTRDVRVSLIRSRLGIWACWLIAVGRSRSVILTLHWKCVTNDKMPLSHILHQWTEYQGGPLGPCWFRCFGEAAGSSVPPNSLRGLISLSFTIGGFPWGHPSSNSYFEHFFRPGSSCPGSTINHTAAEVPDYTLNI